MESQLIETAAGRSAAFWHQKLVGVFNSHSEGFDYCCEHCPDGMFAVGEIQAEPHPYR